MKYLLLILILLSSTAYGRPGLLEDPRDSLRYPELLPPPAESLRPDTRGIPVYDSNQCTGPVIMGECHGGMIGEPKARCHGSMLNGKCTGPMF